MCQFFKLLVSKFTAVHEHFWNCSRVHAQSISDKSTLVQRMAWCLQATNHYLSQCWPKPMSPYMASLGHNELTRMDDEDVVMRTTNCVIWNIYVKKSEDRMYRSSVVILVLASKKYTTFNISELEFLDFPGILRQHDTAQRLFLTWNAICQIWWLLRFVYVLGILYKM